MANSTIVSIKNTSECMNAIDPPFITSITDEELTDPYEKHWGRATLTNSPAPMNAVHMRSNDYLSIATDERIARAKAEVLLAAGHGDAISRVFSHAREDLHRGFERRIAAVTGAEDAVLMMSGYNANTSVSRRSRNQTLLYISISWRMRRSGKVFSAPVREHALSGTIMSRT
ncbi:hypothetical protein [Kordiimonas gwangyangensis]|uniref:hypothetical protein n=1 Tax=Kordiimonas gwangyangensis TaxID=288022 RepID=UPI0012DF9EEB|nr:hypothetical protein [Kordiimonas gwangyangensis]